MPPKQSEADTHARALAILEKISHSAFETNNINEEELQILMRAFPNFVPGNAGTCFLASMNAAQLQYVAQRCDGRMVLVRKDDQWWVGTLVREDDNFFLRVSPKDDNAKLISHRFKQIQFVKERDSYPLTGANVTIDCIVPLTAAFAMELNHVLALLNNAVNNNRNHEQTIQSLQEQLATARRSNQVPDQFPLSDRSTRGSASASAGVTVNSYPTVDPNSISLIKVADQNSLIVNHHSAVISVISQNFLFQRFHLDEQAAERCEACIKQLETLTQGFDPSKVYKGLADVLIDTVDKYFLHFHSSGTNKAHYYINVAIGKSEEQHNAYAAQQQKSKASNASSKGRFSGGGGRRQGYGQQVNTPRRFNQHQHQQQNFGRGGGRGGYRGGNRGGYRPQSSSPSQRTCYNCGGAGHLSYECASPGRAPSSSGNGRRPSSATSSN